MARTEKKFDAVAMMRAARDRLSAAIEGMTLGEARACLARQDLGAPLLERLRDRAARSAGAADRTSTGR
jgi:hypothetical protein